MNFVTRMNHFLERTTLIAAVAVVFILCAAPILRADRYEECHRRIARADHRLHEAIEHHGYRSEQAAHARHNLAEAREHCWSTYHRWWDEDEHRWHTERDWREEDHEHYHEHP